VIQCKRYARFRRTACDYYVERGKSSRGFVSGDDDDGKKSVRNSEIKISSFKRRLAAKTVYLFSSPWWIRKDNSKTPTRDSHLQKRLVPFVGRFLLPFQLLSADLEKIAFSRRRRRCRASDQSNERPLHDVLTPYAVV